MRRNKVAGKWQRGGSQGDLFPEYATVDLRNISSFIFHVHVHGLTTKEENMFA